MRFLILHVNHFCCTITTKGRSQVYEPYGNPVTRVDEALGVLASVERGGERAPDLVARHASMEIVKLAMQLKIATVNLHPFAHFNTLQIDAKGHPLSRVARIVTAGE
jgi:threonyl-tRNA synthetase